MKLNIIYEDNDILVINKPAGLVVHKGVKTEMTLTDLLVEHYPKIINVGDDKTRPGIVHRLDKDTSGLMVVAKNNAAFDFLKEQFKNRQIEKRYTVLVFGRVENQRGKIDSKIGRFGDKQITVNPNQRLGAGKIKIDKYRDAITEYKVLKYFGDYSLCEAKPKTGRMHQIRVHFKSIGHPVAGDKKYYFKKQKNAQIFPRQFLHASYLSFSLPNGSRMAFEADLPEDLQKILISPAFRQAGLKTMVKSDNVGTYK